MVRKRLLVVDDERDNLECVQAVLRQEELDLVAACGGEEALRALATEDFDGLMLDLTMPEVDGFEVMRFVKEHLPNLPVLLASGLPDLEGIARQLGAADFIRKPFQFGTLPQRLGRLMRPTLDA